jgi:hypothetical protein
MAKLIKFEATVTISKLIKDSDAYQLDTVELCNTLEAVAQEIAGEGAIVEISGVHD